MESVWDYPRPPRVEQSARGARVVFGEVTVAESAAPWRVLETSQAPGIYFPPGDVSFEHLRAAKGRSTLCEWKGLAHYYDVVAGERVSERAAWVFDEPTAGFTQIAGCVAFYPQRVDACFLGDERVEANGGDFYGGWITSDLQGPFKGAPGTLGW